MSVKIVTDSSSDLPAQIIKDLDITVVPLYVRFGEQVYRDRIDISEDEFYRRLVRDSVHPSTIQPSPQDFTNVFQKLSKEGLDGIISINISSKLSGTFNSASQAKDTVTNVPVEVIDSEILSVGLGLIVISAAKMAKAGASFQEIVESIKQNLPAAHLMGLLDTLKYVQLGGRIGKAKALLGSLLNVKPVLTLKEGEVMPAGQVRSRSKGIDRLLEFSKGKQLKSLAIAYNTTRDEAEMLADRIGQENIFNRKNIVIARIGPMLGVHMGPGTIIVAYLQNIA
jgi:DegV family protein with EDD domain